MEKAIILALQTSS